MSVATEITRLQTAKANLKTSIEAKGVTVSSSALLDAYPALVDAIPTGGKEEKVLNFYDFDGTLVESYANNEIQNLTALPSAPDHTADDVPLTFDEWNWTLAEIKAYNTANPNAVIIVGANYHTTDGKTHLIFEIDSNSLNAYFYIPSLGGTVDWGDGTIESFSAGAQNHTYSQTGTYDCKIDSTTNNISFGGTNNPPDDKFNNLKKVFLASTITKFQTYFFSKCYYLEAVSIPSGLSFFTNSNAYCFDDCFSIRCIVIPRGTTQLPTGNTSFYFFYGNRAEVISFPGNIQYILSPGKYVSNISIPSGVTTIGTNLFNDNYKIKKVVIPNTVTSLGGNAFLNCNMLQDVVLSSALTSIESQNFSGCSMLRKITIPSLVTTIGSSAFYNCSNLRTVNLSPTGLTGIGGSSFYGCSLLKDLLIPTTVTSLGTNTFYNCSSITNMSIPSDIRSLPQSLFENCKSLTSVSLPSGLTDIGARAFRGCSNLPEITIPSLVTNLGIMCFQNCSNLQTLTCLATTPPTLADTNAIPTNTGMKIYVPYSADHSVLAAYQGASNWSNFASIMEELPE